MPKLKVPGHKKVDEAAELLGMHRVTLYDWIKKLKIKPEKFGNQSLLRDADVERIKQARSTTEE